MKENTLVYRALLSWLTRSLLAAATVACALVLGAARVSADPHAVRPKSFFLVASRDMPDQVFQQSVILMLPPDEPPLVTGVIINKPTDVTMSNLFKQQLAPANRNQKVYFGGPVDFTKPFLLIRTTHPPKEAIQVWSAVYAVDDVSSISEILKDSPSSDDLRLYLGSAQWLQEQLRGELLDGAWSVVPFRADVIFEHDSSKVWPMLVQPEHAREIRAYCTSIGDVLNLTMYGGAFAW